MFCEKCGAQMENDSKFLTEHQSLEGYAKTTEIPKNLSDLEADASHRTVSDTEKTGQIWFCPIPSEKRFKIIAKKKNNC